MSRPAAFGIKLGVCVPIVLGAISNLNLALALGLSMLIRVLRCALVGQKGNCGEEKCSSSTMVKSAPLPTEDTSRR